MSKKPKERFLLDGEIVRRERIECGINQADNFALGLSESQMQRVESGNTKENRETYGLEAENGELLEQVIPQNVWNHQKNGKKESESLHPSYLDTAIRDVATALKMDWLDLVTHKVTKLQKNYDLFRPIPRTKMGIIDGSDVSASFEQIKEYVRGSAISGMAHMSDEPAPPIDIHRIVDFWRPEVHRELSNKLVSTKGMLSEYAPLLAGPPYLKRSIHLDYRSRRESAELSADQVNANLSFTAGQMVWRFNTDWFEWVYLGLYQSIVRNSIPVFVSKPYFDGLVQPQFKSKEATVVDCELVGHAVPLRTFSALLKSLRIPMNEVRPEVMAYAGDAVTHGLFVTGNSGTHISLRNPSAYLDGDIWSYTKSENSDGKIVHRLISRFPNLADTEDVDSARREIQDEIDIALKDETLIDRVNYDESDPFEIEAHTTTAAELRDRLKDG